MMQVWRVKYRSTFYHTGPGEGRAHVKEAEALVLTKTRDLDSAIRNLANHLSSASTTHAFIEPLHAEWLGEAIEESSS